MKKGFGLISGILLVSLLAGLVILATINTTTTKKTVEVIDEKKTIAMDSSFLIVVNAVDDYYKINSMFGNELDYDCMDIASLDTNEYLSCTYSVDNDIVYVTLKSSLDGVFNGTICSGTKDSYECK